MASQCEALVIGKQKKMSVVMSFKRNPDPLLLPAPEKDDLNGLIVYEGDQGPQKVGWSDCLFLFSPIVLVWGFLKAVSLCISNFHPQGFVISLRHSCLQIKNNSFNGQRLAIDSGNAEWFNITSSLLHSSSEECQHSWQSFRLPPSSPYDNFLKAARYWNFDGSFSSSKLLDI